MIAIIKFEFSDLEFPDTKSSSSKEKLERHIRAKLRTIDIELVTVEENLKEATYIASNWE